MVTAGEPCAICRPSCGCSANILLSFRRRFIKKKSQIQGCRSPVCLDATAPLPTRDRYLPPSGEAGLCPCISLQLSTICLRSGTLDLIRSTQSPLLQTVPPELQKAILSHKSPSQSPTALNATNGTTGRILSYPKSRRGSSMSQL